MNLSQSFTETVVNEDSQRKSSAKRRSSLKEATTHHPKKVKTDADLVDAEKLDKVENVLQETKSALDSKKSTKKSLANTSEKLLSVIEDLKVKCTRLIAFYYLILRLFILILKLKQNLIQSTVCRHLVRDAASRMLIIFLGRRCFSNSRGS